MGVARHSGKFDIGQFDEAAFDIEETVVATDGVVVSEDFSGNKIVNGGFELGFSGNPAIPYGWSNGGLDANEGVDNTTDPYVGDHCFLMTGNLVFVGSVNEGIWQTVSLTVGTSYDISIWLRKRDLENVEIKVTKGGTTDVHQTVGTGYTSWAQWTHTFTATSTGSYAFIINGMSNPASVKVDSVSLRPSGQTRPRVSVEKNLTDVVLLSDREIKSVDDRTFTDGISLSDTEVKEATKSVSDGVVIVESGTLTIWKKVVSNVWKPMEYVFDLFKGFPLDDWVERTGVSATWSAVASMAATWAERTGMSTTWTRVSSTFNRWTNN